MAALILGTMALTDMAVRLYAGHGPLRACWTTVVTILVIAVN